MKISSVRERTMGINIAATAELVIHIDNDMPTVMNASISLSLKHRKNHSLPPSYADCSKLVLPTISDWFRTE